MQKAGVMSWEVGGGILCGSLWGGETAGENLHFAWLVFLLCISFP